MGITINQAAEIYSAISNNVFADLKGVKVTYALARNKAILKNELEILEKTFVPSEKFLAYESERSSLLQELAEKDDKGNPKIANNEYVLSPANISVFKEALDKLKVTYEKEIKEREEQVAKFNSLLEEPISFTLHKIRLEDIPEDINQNQMNLLLPLIEE
jgi:predicted acyltransferase (DUF342 family)